MNDLINILFFLIALAIVYQLLRIVTGRSGWRIFNRNFFKYLIILIVFAIGFELLINYLTAKPKFLTSTIEELHKRPEITKEIGEPTGFSYNKNKIKKIKNLPADFKITLIGNEGELDLNVTVDSSNNIYELTKIEVLREKYAP